MSKASVRPSAPSPPARRPAWQWPLLVLGGGLAAYLVGRGTVELATVHYGDPASYAKDWGGPSLAGVLAVHSGPALVIIGALGWRLRRRLRARRRPAA